MDVELGNILGMDQVKSKKRKKPVNLKALIRMASVAGGVQFGWALQLSLLTPYVQELGIPHTFASYIWLCGPITGMLVQPTVGYFSDKCESRWGRRKPFIVVGAIAVAFAVLLIGFSADIGHLFGDPLSGMKHRAIAAFVLGFWCLDLANNTLQGPCRAMLADFTGKNQQKTRKANAYFSLFMAIGNVLGFATGSFSNWPKIFPFAKTKACNLSCANLKSAFFIHIILLIGTTILSVTAARENVVVERQSKQQEQEQQQQQQSKNTEDVTKSSNLAEDSLNEQSSPSASNILSKLDLVIDSAASIDVAAKANGSNKLHLAEIPVGKGVENGRNSDIARAHSDAVKQMSIMAKENSQESDEQDDSDAEKASRAFFCELFSALKTLPRPMWFILSVTALTWIAWFPFLLFDTDWMGREVYQGEPNAPHPRETSLYDRGVRMGAFGLVLNSVVSGLFSLLIEPLCRHIGPKYLWTASNIVMAVCFAFTAVITRIAGASSAPPSVGVVVSVLFLFAILGAPLAVTFSIPYALTASFTSSRGGGQGLSMGILNLSIVIPQVIISLGSGPWDAAFGGGNIPAFLLAAAAALLGGILALFKLPKPPVVKDVVAPLPYQVGIRRTRSCPEASAFFLKYV